MIQQILNTKSIIHENINLKQKRKYLTFRLDVI